VPPRRNRIRSTGRTWPVERIAFHRLAAGFTDQLQQFVATQALLGGRPGVVVDALFHDRAVDVIRPKTQPVVLAMCWSGVLPEWNASGMASGRLVIR
jgi:hypothetical protein